MKKGDIVVYQGMIGKFFEYASDDKNCYVVVEKGRFYGKFLTPVADITPINS